MVCFCQDAAAQVAQAMSDAKTDPAEAPAESAQASPLRDLAAKLAAEGLPAAPWTPDPAWIDTPLPALQLGAGTMVTISAFAQLRADALAQFNIDLLVPGQAIAFQRLAATLGARLSSMSDANPAIDPAPWTRLAGTMAAVAPVAAAAQSGQLQPDDAPSQAQTQTAAQAQAPYKPFLSGLRPLLPLIAASSQLGLSLSADLSADLAAGLRIMLRIAPPALSLPSVSLMASLTAMLSALAQLRSSLGVDPLAAGLPAVQDMVNDHVAQTTDLVQQATGQSPADLLGQAPRDYCPSLIAPPDVVSAALSIDAQALAAMTWQAPPVSALPVLSVGLPLCALAAQIKAALDIAPSLSPCGGKCDAASLLNAAGAGLASA